MSNKRKHNKNRPCEYCGKVTGDVEYTPNPYALQLHDDDTKHWLCSDCTAERAEAI